MHDVSSCSLPTAYGHGGSCLRPMALQAGRHDGSRAAAPWLPPPPLLLLLLLLAGTVGTGAREIHRNRDDLRRSRLTQEKAQHVERVVRYADHGDGRARLEALDLYDPGTQLVVELLTTQYTELVEVELDDNSISDASAEGLARAVNASTQLRILHLDGNHLTGDGMAALADALATSKLRVLHLNDNMLQDDGAATVASVIRRSRTLRDVSLKRNDIGAAGAREVLRAVQASPSPFLRNVRMQGNLPEVGPIHEQLQQELLSRLRGDL
jgi:hypothetical protein